MARTATLLELRTRAKTRADMTGSSFLSDTEWNELLNQSIADYYDELVAQEMAPVTTATITGVALTKTYALPTDFLSLVNVGPVDASGNYLGELERYSPSELAEQTMSGDADFPAYRVQGTLFGSATPVIAFAPAPTAGRLFLVSYVPVSPTLSADSDKMDGVNGWEEFVVCDAAAKAQEKEESDATANLARREQARERIRACAPNRDTFKSVTVRDVERGALDTGLAYRR